MAHGFRAFHVAYGDGEAFILPSVDRASASVAMEYPNLEATCLASGQHRAPQPKCTCGYHAYKEASGAVEYARYDGFTGIMADVWGHGPVMHHETGFRARYLQVVNFYHPFCKCGRPATVAEASPIERKWIKRLTFHCEQCAPTRHTAKQTAFLGDALIPVAVVLESLASKFQVGVFDIEESQRMMDGFRDWNQYADDAIRQGKVARAEEYMRLTRLRQEAAERKARIEQARRDGAQAQQGLGV